MEEEEEEEETDTISSDSGTSPEYDTFLEGLKKIMAVPKSEIDRREAEYQESKKDKKKK